MPKGQASEDDDGDGIDDTGNAAFEDMWFDIDANMADLAPLPVLLLKHVRTVQFHHPKYLSHLTSLAIILPLLHLHPLSLVWAI